MAIIMMNWAEEGSEASVRIGTLIRCEMVAAELIQAQDKRQMSILRKRSFGFASSWALAQSVSVSGMETPSASGATWDYLYGTGLGDANETSNGDGAAHQVSSSTLNCTGSVVSTGNSITGLMAAFKQAPAGAVVSRRAVVIRQ